LFGLGQPAADGLKFIFKEEYTPAHVNRVLYVLAPIAILIAALAVFAVIPFGNVLPVGEQPIELVVVPGVNVALLYIFALSSVAVYGVILGGWASNNKYSFLGALRSSAQLIAYELPLGLGLLGIVLASGSLDLSVVIQQQANGMWFALAQPLGFSVFTIAAFAEAARLPFDLPECEQELVGGYHTEYAGMKLLLFLVAEFLHMITASYLIVILFLGGWHLPWLTQSSEMGWGLAFLRIVVLNVKVFLVILFFMLVRWSWPRFRFDQLMALAWKVMLPLGLVNLVVVAFMNEIDAHVADGNLWLVSTVVAWIVCVLAWILITAAGPVVADNRPHEYVWQEADESLRRGVGTRE
jgi:NADH-quinone oxidoreductase subunit H